MKTNQTARRIRKIRSFLGVLTIVAITIFELGMGYYCLSNWGRNTLSSNTVPPGSIPNVSASDFFVAIR
jgi:hypothetical protein